jgi:hypothetical protein
MVSLYVMMARKVVFSYDTDISTDQSTGIDHSLHSRDGKVRFGPVLQGILENQELDYWFGP